MPASFRGDEMVEFQTAHRAQNGGAMAVWEASDNLEGLLRRHQDLTTQHPTQRVELRRRPVREIGQGPAFDLTTLPIAFPAAGWLVEKIDSES